MDSKIQVIGAQPKRKDIDNNIVVGKDVLELFAGAMYAEPLSIYREYVQNAADSIDEARERGLMPNKEADVAILFNQLERTVRIRDYGAGVPNSDFIRRLTAIGGSGKRGSAARGFRGIGRLSGLGYCQELVFRSRSPGDKKVMEMRWDGRVLRDRLRDASFSGSLTDLIREVAIVDEFPGAEFPAHFFEVELRKILRVRNDVLLNEEAVRGYLSEVAPVPFDPEFQFGAQINGFLESHGLPTPIRLVLNDTRGYIYHRARNHYPVSPKVLVSFDGIDFFECRNNEGELLAYGWLLDHAYSGAIAKSLRLGGIRMRHKNVQVGDADTLAAAYPEARFAHWPVGDLHVAHPRIIPNGRRDEFEHTPAYSQLADELRVVTRSITQRIRSRSDQRTKLRKVQVQLTYAEEWLESANAARVAVIAAAMTDKAEQHANEAGKALAKLAAPDYTHTTLADQLARTKALIAQKIKARKGKDWSTDGGYAAVSAVLSSSVKPEPVTGLAERVVEAITTADAARLGLNAARAGT
jgi:molecular chaperone HtpG